MEQKKLLTASPLITVSKAAKLMAKRNVGAIMVVDGRRLVGIFTERDALFRVIARDLDSQTTRLVEVMTKAPITAAPDNSFGYALLIMHENGFRHVPVIEDGKLWESFPLVMHWIRTWRSSYLKRNGENISCASELEVAQPTPAR